MSKKTIVLADNSYTIRRIVELSFSDETDIELITFENGLNLKEKLLELRPQIVLVDIKLPEFNGYDLCYFVQGTESLKHTKVFLLKGGFEPIDEALLEGLKYEDIITKPFDSNALVSNIKALLQEMPAQAPSEETVTMPSSLPEDEELPPLPPEPVPEPEPDQEINFSDLNKELHTEDILATPGMFPEDDILPSEEITRARPDKDTITPSLEEDENPFQEPPDIVPATAEDAEEDIAASLAEEELNIKRNIQLQEQELDIDSLTLEEINIKQNIEKQEKEWAQAQAEQQELIPPPPPINEDHDMPPMPPISDQEPTFETNTETDTDDLFPQAKMEPEEELFSLGDHQPEEDHAPPPPVFSEMEEELFAKEDSHQTELPEINYESETEKESLIGIDMEPEPSYFEEEKKPAMESPIIPEPQIPEPQMPEAPQPPLFEEMPPEIPQVPGIPEVPEEPEIPKMPEIPETQEEQIPSPPQSLDTSSQEVLTKIEDKLTRAIKEMLWEIVPPLAEKIIKDEIEALKLQAENALK